MFFSSVVYVYIFWGEGLVVILEQGPSQLGVNKSHKKAFFIPRPPFPGYIYVWGTLVKKSALKNLPNVQIVKPFQNCHWWSFQLEYICTSALFLTVLIWLPSVVLGGWKGANQTVVLGSAWVFWVGGRERGSQGYVLIYMLWSRYSDLDFLKWTRSSLQKTIVGTLAVSIC